MRRKQVCPELKLFEFDTLKYVTKDNVIDSIHYVGIYPERMSPADVTFSRKSGLLDSSYDTFHLSKVALLFILGFISYSEYAFLMLSKQWIKTTNIGNKPIVYNEPLLVFVLDEIQNRGRIKKNSFTQDMDKILESKYAPIILSNFDSLRYIRTLLIESNLVIVENADYMINPIATSIVQDLVLNKDKFIPPTEESEYESYWNTMEHGVFDIITSSNKKIYSFLYPNLIKYYEKNF